MGEKVTRAAQSSDLVRAKLLREALDRGTPGLSRAPEADPALMVAQARGAAQQAYLEDLVECAPEAVSIIHEFDILRINGEFTKMFGLTAPEAVGRRIDELIVPSDRGAESQWIG